MDLNKYGIEITQELKELLLRMMEFDPSKRITFEELYNHPFFNKSNIKRAYFDSDNDLST